MAESNILVGLYKDQDFWLKLEGDVRVPWSISLETYCETVIKQPGIKNIVIDLTSAINIDSTTLGVLAKISKYSQKFLNKTPTLILENDDIKRLISSSGLTSFFEKCEPLVVEDIYFDNLPVLASSDDEIKKAVIAAHETLMDLTEDNLLKFGGLVKSLYKS